MDHAAFLTALRRRLRRLVVADAGARLLGLALAAVGVLALLDRVNPLPSLLRLLALLALLTVLAGMVWRRLLRPLSRRLASFDLARLIERREPSLDGRLFAAVEGITLVESDRTRMESCLGPSLLRRLACNPSLPRRWAGTGLLFLALGSLALARPEAAAIAMQRLFLPFSAARWPATHSLQAELERPVVAADQSMVLLADGSGRPAPLLISTRERSAWRELRRAQAQSGPWRERLSLPVGEHELRVEWADAEAVELRGSVVERPSVQRIDLWLEPPAYTEWEAGPIPSAGGVALLPGSRLRGTLRLRGDVRAADRQLAALFVGEKVDLEEDQAGSWSFDLTVHEAGTLRFALSEGYTEGVRIEARPAPELPIALLEDRPPRVAIEGPRRNEAVSPQAVLELRVVASDDIGLASLELFAGGAEDRLDSLRSWPEVAGTRGSTERRYRLRIGSLAGVGSELVLVAEARDANDVDGPGVGRSEPLRLRVVDAAALRTELERLLTEARDRVIQARDQLAEASDYPARRERAVRSARSIAERAGGSLAEVERRWRENQLEDEPRRAIEAARVLVDERAATELDRAAAGADEAVRAADRSLGEAERLLAGLLRSGDLLRELSAIAHRQRQLGEASQTHVRGALAEGLDAQRGEELAARQRELAEQLREWERRLLGSEAETLSEARELVRDARPSLQLAEAARRLAGEGSLHQAVIEQTEAQAVIDRLLEALKGGDAAARLAELAGELARRQERVQARLEGGADPLALRETQAELREQTGELARRLRNETDDDQAAAMTDAAEHSQQQAEADMDAGRRSPAAAAAGAAASQLRAVQRRLQGEQEPDEADDDQEPPTSRADVLALLRRLAAAQRRVVAQATEQHLAWREQRGPDVEVPQSYGERRALAEVADLEEEILLQLRQDGLALLDQMPIAARALGRVDAAVDRALQHLRRPALGDRGLRLTNVALAEMERLLAVIAAMPEPQSSGQEGQGGGEGDGPPPFPPAAQLALLAAEQERVALATAARAPLDLIAGQEELHRLLDMVAAMTRPGSRPFVLAQRAVRGAASAADLLETGDRGVAVRGEQEAVLASLQQMMREAEAGGGSGEAPPQQPSQGEDEPQQGRSRPSEADEGEGEQQAAEAGDAAAEAGEQVVTGRGDGTDALGAADAQDAWMHLPLRDRQRLRWALRDRVPPDGIMLLRRYLELLEDQP